MSQRLLSVFGRELSTSQQAIEQLRTHAQRLELIGSGSPLLLLPVEVRVR
jgi:hypothetical protein